MSGATTVDEDTADVAAHCRHARSTRRRDGKSCEAINRLALLDREAIRHTSFIDRTGSKDWTRSTTRAAAAAR